MSMALPGDAPPDKLYATVFAEMVKNTAKPVIATATSLEDIRQIHSLASIVVGDAETLRKRPFFLAYLEPISPLKLDRGVAERVLYCAEHDIPIIFAAGANCGSGAPITSEAGVVQGGAESLAGLVLALLKNEAAKFVYGSNTSVMDMATSIVSYGAPEWFRTVAMYADMGKYYDLPSWGTAGCSDSFAIDAQAAMEAYEGILMAHMAGATLAHDVGFLAHGVLYDAKMLVLADEMIKRARHLLKPVDLSERTLAADVIDEVARKNELYLAHAHTAELFREALWLAPSYINRRSVIESKEGRALADLLGERVTSILSSHEAKELPAAKAEEIDEYLRSL
jgi:trimethylamine--corrinoid protein Co-methyltransferase